MNTSPIHENNEFGIAIIGLSGRFPGANTLDEYWQNLVNQVESITAFSDDMLREAGVNESLISDPNYVKAAPVLDGPGLFDAAFFGYSPREAQFMDPQQRLFLETAWQALEQAGYDPNRFPGPIGVFGGSAMNTYLLFSGLLPHFVSDYLPTLIGSDKDFLTTRVSYKLNLTGPSVTVQTACSTSLVAIHTACQSLLNAECDLALAGGVAVRVPHVAGHLYEEGSVFTPDGHCRAFDAGANGTIFGSGVGVVALKRLEDALEDGDAIHAVIKGSAINNDGASKADYTAPSVNSQAEAIIDALANADVTADTISYIEAHGTGTYLGDPIEIAALTKAFRVDTAETGFCAIGSVKTNVGHLDAAAGMAGLTKTVLALKHKQIPATINFERNNPEITFENTPFYVNKKLTDWAVSDNLPRRAGISSLGIGGTNAHLILEEAPRQEPSGPSRPYQLLVLSAKTETALATASQNLAAHLKQHPAQSLADVAYTLQQGRQPFEYRQALICQTSSEAISILEAGDIKHLLTRQQPSTNRELVFMFSGQGSQYVNMGRELYDQEPVFQRAVEQCATLLESHLGLDLRTILYPAQAEIDVATEKLNQTQFAQPALFTIEYALAQLWLSWGVEPDLFVGHSIGEYVAACLAGVFSLEDGLALVAARGRLMQSLPAGSMLAVPLSEADVAPYLNDQLAVAVINTPNMCVVSGETAAIEALQQTLAGQDLDTRLLHTSHAFHSPMMDPILAEFKAKVATVNLQAPTKPIVSNVTGGWLKPEEATDPAYWANHIRQTVRFADCIETLLAEPSRVFLEVGPGQALSSLVKQHPSTTVAQPVIFSTRHPRQSMDDNRVILAALGQLWLADVEIDWAAFYDGERRHRVHLPTYPFERTHYWFQGQRQSRQSSTTTAGQADLVLHGDPADWFYTPSWKRQPLPNAIENIPTSTWLIFADGSDLAAACIEDLVDQNIQVYTVTQGNCFNQAGHSFTLNPHLQADYVALFQALSQANELPKQIVYLWNLQRQASSLASEIAIESQYASFNNLLFLAQAISQHLPENSTGIKLGVATTELYDVIGNESIHPLDALLLGPCRVIPKEYPEIACFHLDFDLASLTKPAQHKKFARDLLIEFNDPPSQSVAYRSLHRWVEILEPVRLSQPSTHISLRQQGVYLITGGLGGIGLVLAEYLAKTVQAKLILLRRSPFPSKSEWELWLENHDETDETSQQIMTLQQCEASGAAVLILQADVADKNQMTLAIEQGLAHYGDINGVIHTAGVVNDGLIEAKTSEQATQVLNPKVNGTLILNALTSHLDLDWLLLCSSINAYLAPAGQVDYVAANAFLDAFAHYNTINQDRRTHSINWPGWQDVGLLARMVEQNGDQPWQKNIRQKSINPTEGIDAFVRILNQSLPQITVSKTDIQVELNQIVKPTVETSYIKSPNYAISQPQTQSPTDYVAPRNDIEQAVATIWQELLGVPQVSMQDDFVALGGNSLLSTQIISRIRKRFDVRLTIQSFFDLPTVAQLSENIAAQLASPATEDGLPPSADDSPRKPKPTIKVAARTVYRPQ